MEKSIRLEPMTDEMYIEYFRHYQNDPDLYLNPEDYRPYVYDTDTVAQYIQRQRERSRIPFAIMCGDEMVGEVKLYDIEARKSAWLGIALKNDSWKNRGIGTRAEQLAAAYVFYELDIPVLCADAVRTNLRSRHVLEKVGFAQYREDESRVYYRLLRKNPVIRKGRDLDIDRVAALYDAVCDDLARRINYPGWRKGIYPTREDAEQGIRENALFVAEQDGELIGTFILRHTPEEGYAKADWKTALTYEKILVIYTLAVHPDCAHRGVGERLTEAILAYAACMGMGAVRLDVYDGNTPAIRLYEKMGFSYVDTVDLGYGEYGLDRFRLYQKLL